MTSVLVCDDSPLAREALRRAVATVPGVGLTFTIIAAYVDQAEGGIAAFSLSPALLEVK